MSSVWLDGQRRAVHDLQMVAAVRQTHAGGDIELGIVQPASRFLAHRADNVGAVVGLLPGDDVDLVRDVALVPLGVAVYSSWVPPTCTWSPLEKLECV